MNYRGAGEHGAMNDASGTTSANIPYRESYFIIDSLTGIPMTLTGLTIEVTFRPCGEWRDDYGWTGYNATSELSLSTADSTLILEDIENEQGVTVSSFRPAAVDVSSLSGDYIMDVVYTDALGVEFHLAHGVVTWRQDPA